MPFVMAFSKEEILNKNPYFEITNEIKIMQALDLLDGTPGEWAKEAIKGNNLTQKPIKISFKNLSEISPAYANFDALGWKQNNRLYIYINSKHKNAPQAALACILCHEAIHQDEFSSIEEETYGWSYEASQWIIMKKRFPELTKYSSNDYPLVGRLNTLEKMFKDANFTSKEIRRAVANNPGYADLPQYSPGFGK